MTACTLPVAEGMVIRTDTPQVAQARKAMLEFVLTNHPMDCPVCDKGGECELQDATLTYGAGEGRFDELKQHFDELQWSPVGPTMTGHDAFCVFAACESATKAWACERSVWPIERAPPRSFQYRRPSGVRRMRNVHRHLPGWCLDERHVTLQNTSMGDEPCGNDLHPLRGRL